MGKQIKEFRKECQLTMMDVSTATGIDQALLSKYESGKRIPSEKHLRALSNVFNVSFLELNKIYLAEKIAQLVRYEPNSLEILELAETRIEYLNSAQSLSNPTLNDDILSKIARVDLLKNQWQNNKPLNRTQLLKMQEYFHIKYTYESNQIEGNTLSHQETSLIIQEGITISGKSMTEHLEVINHADAIDFIGDLVNGKEDISKRTLLEIHRLVLKSIDQMNAGKYRTVPVRISGSAHLPPQPVMIDKLMDEYFIHYTNQKKKLHPIIMAAEMHERLVSIHPFIDGNGRTSRLVMNFILLKNGYTVTSLKGDLKSRLRYYKALEQVQVHNDPTEFYHLILDRLIDSLEEHLSLI